MLQRLRRLKDLAPKIARLSAFVTVLFLIGIGIAVLQARAQMTESLMDFGVHMMRYAEVNRQDAPRSLWLNGQEMKFSTGTTRHSVDQVLDFYEARCVEHSTRMHEQFAQLQRIRGEQIQEADTSALDGILRHEDDGRGFVACLDMGGGEHDLADINRRLQEFEETGDLSRIGHLRYAYADRGDRSENTHLVTFWTEGSLDVYEMFPDTGDAPGTDIRDVPRPPGGRRILAAWEEGHPESMLVYTECNRRKEGLLGFYRESLADRGWTVFENDALQRAQAEGARMIVAEKAQRMVTLVFTDDEQGRGVTTVLTSR
jgi:hypothetical protein